LIRLISDLIFTDETRSNYPDRKYVRIKDDPENLLYGKHMKNKIEALERLSALETETKALRKIIEMPDSSKAKWEDIRSFLDATDYLTATDPEIKKYQKLLTILDVDDWICAVQRVVIISKALNEGIALTMHDKRWYPYFNVSSGFVFNFTHCVGTNAITSSASRLCVGTQDKALHFAKYFLPELKALITG